MYKSKVSTRFKPPRPSSSHVSSSNETISSKRHCISTTATNATRLVNPSSPPKDESLIKQSLDPNGIDNRREKYLVQWRKRTNKKNKTWDGDGELFVQYHSDSVASLFLRDSDGKLLGKKPHAPIKGHHFSGVISIGIFELEVDYMVEDDISNTHIDSSDHLQEKGTSSQGTGKILVQQVALSSKAVIPATPAIVPPKTSCETNSITKTGEDSTISIDTTDMQRSDFIDPLLAKKLRAHQIEGVTFIYECIMGHRTPNMFGCLVADEMGLGKTLMTVTLIWSLFKRNLPQKPKPVFKTLICCPVTLIDNWKHEFEKWLGRNKIGILTLTGSDITADKQSIANFAKFNVYQVLLLNYEKILLHHIELARVKFDILVCDEGHRLKNSANKVLNHLTGLCISRKIMLTGTPIQNDLVEFFTITDFLNPGLLGKLKTFQKSFIIPILRSRDVNCVDPGVKAIGEEASQQLIEITKSFTIRRTQAVLTKYLTNKTDIILYVAPTKLQTALFKFIMDLHHFNQILQDEDRTIGSSNVFGLINLFKKVCNSPSLLLEDALFKSISAGSSSNPLATCSNALTSSGKLNVLIPILLELVNLCDKIVLVSNYTKTLDIFEIVLKKLNLMYSRLDGSTPHSTRGKLVSEFNQSSRLQVFLLSSKSGGMGINLTGASRLVLFDSDWNPSVDQQSMARIYRDGQTKPCYIYRFLVTGCIDEKIFQRQLKKQNLSSKFLDNDGLSKTDVFENEVLKDLFTIHAETFSNTHDLIQCECTGSGNNSTQTPFDSEKVMDKAVSDPFTTISSQSPWISANDLKLQANQSELHNIDLIKETLSDYKHFCILLDRRMLISEEISDPVLSNIVGNKNYNNDSNKLPITFIMLKGMDELVLPPVSISSA